MGSFYTVTTGAVTASADVNQYANQLNGVTGTTVALLASSSTSVPLALTSPAAPTSDRNYATWSVSGDVTPRLGAYVRGADGYGGIRAGAGSSVAAHLYAQAGGWKIDESLTVATNLSVSGTTALAGLIASGTSSLDNGAITTDGAGHLTTSGQVSTGGGLRVSGGGIIVSSGYTSLDNGAVLTDGNGNLTLNGVTLKIGAAAPATTGTLLFFTGNNTFQLKTPQAGSAAGFEFFSWDGAASHQVFGIGSVHGGVAAYVDDSGNLVAPTLAGTFTDTVGGAGAAIHDDGTTVEFKPTTSSRGSALYYRDSGGTPHAGLAVSAAGAATAYGSLNAVGHLFDNGNAVPIQGTHSAGQPILSYGTGVPASLAANEIYFQLA